MIYSEDYFSEKDSNAIGQQAKATKKLINKLDDWAPNALKLVISQQMMNITNQGGFAEMTGGKFLEHVASVAVKFMVRPGTGDKSGKIRSKVSVGDYSYDYVSSLIIRWRIDKSKVGYEGIIGDYEWSHNGGIILESELLDAGLKYGVISKAGSMFGYAGFKVRGAAEFIKALKDDPDLFGSIRSEVFKKATGE